MALVAYANEYLLTPTDIEYHNISVTRYTFGGMLVTTYNL